ncbi:MAG: hypothetical protein RDV41_11200, partial [Planctomycetota bacterium]|nr:hypothetical protein [Planctomycetota bacterium]
MKKRGHVIPSRSEESATHWYPESRRSETEFKILTTRKPPRRQGNQENTKILAIFRAFGFRFVPPKAG